MLPAKVINKLIQFGNVLLSIRSIVCSPQVQHVLQSGLCRYRFSVGSSRVNNCLTSSLNFLECLLITVSESRQVESYVGRDCRVSRDS